MTRSPSIPGENPFCTRRIRPRALPYLFPEGASWEILLERLKNSADWGEIIGPHGSGKSTLLAGLIPRLEAESWQVVRFDLHDGERPLLVKLREFLKSKESLGIGAGTSVAVASVKERNFRGAKGDGPVEKNVRGAKGDMMVIVDGYEQLGRWGKFWLKRHCRRCGWGLIVTAHRSVGLPRLCDTTASLEMARRVVAALVENGEYPVSEQEIADRYVGCEGNLREMLFGFYDLYERQRF